MGFKQITEETRGVMIYLYNKKKSQRFIAEETGTSRKDAQGVLKQWRGLNVILNLEEKRKSSKISDRTMAKGFFGKQETNLQEVNHRAKVQYWC